MQSKALLLQHRGWDTILILAKGASTLLNESVCIGMTATARGCLQGKMKRKQRMEGAVLAGQGKPRQISMLALNSLLVLASATPPLWGEAARAQALTAAITSSEHGSRQQAHPV